MADSTKIIVNGFVFTGDAQHHAGKMTLLLTNDRIVEIGKHPDILKRQHPNAEVIDASGKIIFPGFIDAHFSGESFLLHFITLGHPSAKWKRIASTRKAFEYIRETATPEDFASLYRLAYFAALRSGITTVAEFGMDHLDTSFRASFEAMQRSELRGFIGIHNADQIEAARTLHDPSIKFSLVIENEADLTTYGLQSTIRAAKEFQWPITLHLGQTLDGFETMKRNFHTSIIQFYNEYHLFDLPVHLVHLVNYEEPDYELLTKAKRTLIVSPNAILKKGTPPPPIEKLAAYKIPIALGTDWGTPSPLENIRAYSSMLQSLSLPAEKSPFNLLALHTRHAAAALGMASEIGSIEVGKKADLTFIDATDIRLSSIVCEQNPELTLRGLLEEATSHDVSDVLINGEFYIRERHILTYAEEDLTRESSQWMKELLNRIAEKSSEDDRPPAPIIPLSDTQLESPDDDNEIISAEEGFRIIKRKNETPHSSRTSDKHHAPTLPENTRRVFGDDDDV